MATSRGPAPAEPGTFNSSRRPSFVPPSPGGSSEPSSPYISPVAVRRRQGALTLDSLDPEIMSTLTLPPPAPPRRRGAVSGASGPALPFPALGRPEARRGLAARSRGPSPQGSSADGPAAPQPTPSDMGPTSLAPISLPDRTRSGSGGNASFTRSPIAFPPASSFYENPAPSDGRSSTHDGLSFYAASSVSGPGPSASIPASWTDLRRGSRGSAPPLDGIVPPSGAHSIIDGVPPSSSAAPPASYVGSSSSTAYAPHPAYSMAQHTSGMPGFASSSPPHPASALSHTANGATFGLARPWAPSMTSGPDGREIIHATSSFMPGNNGGREEERYYDMNKPKPRSGPRVDNDVPRNFRCQYAGCPARFQRNHDLKRHQRGHLATRPFACTCGKSFSRKDALKRHMLVKGCGGSSSRREDSEDDSPKRGNKRDTGKSKQKGQNQPQQPGHDDGARSDDEMDEGDYDENEDEQDYNGRDRATSGASQTSWHQQQQHARVVSAPNHGQRGHDGASLSPASVPRNASGAPAPELLLESWNDGSHPGMARTSSSDTARPVSNSSDARSIVSPGMMHAQPNGTSSYAPTSFASYKSNVAQPPSQQRSAYSYANVDARNPVTESDAVYLGGMDESVMSGAALARRESTAGLFFQQPRAMQ